MNPSRYSPALVALAATAALVMTAQPATAADTSAVPTGVHIGDKPCETAPPGSFHRSDGPLSFRAAVEPEVTAVRWALWPITDPTQRRELPWSAQDGNAHGQVEQHTLTADTTYQLVVRTEVGDDTSAWTEPCSFTTDWTRPAVASVTSAVYLTSDPWERRGGLGISDEFTFTAGGSADVASYSYRIRHASENGSWNSVRAISPGGPATVAFTPAETGTHHVTVVAVDRAGNRSWETSRQFTVRDIRPQVWSTLYKDYVGGPAAGNIGVPGVFEFSQGMPDVVEYSYRLEDGPTSTVAADADGKAKQTLAPTHGGWNVLYVKNTDRNGTSSTDRAYRFYVDTRPVITRSALAIGSEGTFRVTSRLAGTTEYEYWFKDWNSQTTPKQTVPAAVDGYVEIKWTPRHHRFNTVFVVGRTADGTASETGLAELTVDAVAPAITLSGAETPGAPGTLKFASTLEGVTEYTYDLDEGDGEVSVPAGPDGTATISWSPARGGYHYLSARARNAAGYVSDIAIKPHTVDDMPVVSSKEFPRNGVAGRVTGTFDLAPRQLDVVAYSYTVDGQPHQTVQAGADGKASFTWTPPRDGWFQLRISSRNAAGANSEEVFYNVRIVSTN